MTVPQLLTPIRIGICVSVNRTAEYRYRRHASLSWQEVLVMAHPDPTLEIVSAPAPLGEPAAAIGGPPLPDLSSCLTRLRRWAKRNPLPDDEPGGVDDLVEESHQLADHRAEATRQLVEE